MTAEVINPPSDENVNTHLSLIENLFKLLANYMTVKSKGDIAETERGIDDHEFYPGFKFIVPEFIKLMEGVLNRSTELDLKEICTDNIEWAKKLSPSVLVFFSYDEENGKTKPDFEVFEPVRKKW